MSHVIEPEQLVQQALLMETYGANCLYVTDSAGYMLPEDDTALIELLREKASPWTEIGFHGHHNLSMGVANSVAAVRAGVRRIDTACGGFGAGAGNTPTVAVCSSLGIDPGVDLFEISDAAEDIIPPTLDSPIRTRSRWATPECIRHSCSSRNARSSATASPRATFSSSWINANWWAVRRLR